MSDSSTNIRKPVLLIAAGALLLVAALIFWNQRNGVTDQPVQAAINSYEDLNLEDPQPSFLLLQYVADKGGDSITRQFSIDWLSEQSRLRIQLKPDQEKWLFAMLESGGHPDWDMNYKQWLFNDAFNVLHMAKDQKRLTKLLKSLALTHEDKTMRLYALQHIEQQRLRGHLVGELAEDMRATLRKLVYDKQSEVVGTALVNLIAWDGPKSEPSSELIGLALELAADTQRTNDIRVTALHAVGKHSLDLARRIAPDTKQIVHVRKAAIATIGEHGNQEDLALLEQLKAENFRIAQAAEPALKALQARKNGKADSSLIPL